MSFVESAKITIDRVFKGDEAFAIMEESLLDSIKVNPIGEKTEYKLSELIKTRQYYVSEFFQKIGISANQNMKKERLTDNESELISSVSSISFDYIVNNINSCLKKVNKLFNLNITCSINNPEPLESSQLDSKAPEQEAKEPEQETKEPEIKEPDEG